jgi:hypothetical protein
MAVTWTQADVDALKDAIKGGVLTVSYSGPPARTITYQSLDKMRELLASMSQNVDAQGSTVSSHRVASTKKGF